VASEYRIFVVSSLLPDDGFAQRGFAFVHADRTRPMLERHGALSDWAAFTASWANLELDRYTADGGRYRRRRHAVFTVTSAGAIRREPHQPHYQDREYNALNGGVARWFEPIADEIGASPSLRTILAFCGDLFGGLSPGARSWRVEAHQFRIEAQPGVSGQPPPRGRAPRRGRLRACPAHRPEQHRQRHDDDSRSRSPLPRGVHPDYALRRGSGA